MNAIQLNIGLNGTSLDAVRQALGNPSRLIVAQSASEPTACVVIPDAPDDIQAWVMTLCSVLNQDCIAGKKDGVGFLYGPRAAEWGGAFNPAYWLDPITESYAATVKAYDALYDAQVALDAARHAVEEARTLGNIMARPL